MITRPPRWRARRRPLLYGTTAMLCGMTIALAVLSVAGYVRYQQRATEARTATASALKAKTFTSDIGLLTADGNLSYNCNSLSCSIALKPSTDMTSDAIRSKHLHIVSKSGDECQMPVDLFRHTYVDVIIVTAGSAPTNENVERISMFIAIDRPASMGTVPDCLPDHTAALNDLMGSPGPDGQARTIYDFNDLNDLMGTPGPDGQTSTIHDLNDPMGTPDPDGLTRTIYDLNDIMGTPSPDGQTRTIYDLNDLMGTAVIQGMDRVDRIDFLDEAGKVIISVQVSPDPQGKFHLTAPSAADSAAKAAQNAMKNLIAVSGGALLTLIALSALGWIAARGRFGPRRAPQRQGQTGRGTRQQSSCDKTWADRVTIGLITSAVRALDHPDDQDRYREEWSADSDEITDKWRRLRWALLLRLCAPMGIRSARRDALSMSPPQQQ